jgi:hypothetical protein
LKAVKGVSEFILISLHRGKLLQILAIFCKPLHDDNNSVLAQLAPPSRSCSVEGADIHNKVDCKSTELK